MDERFGVDDTRALVHRSDRIDSGDRGAHQLLLQGRSLVCAKRIHQSPISTCPSEIRDLVHGTIKWHRVALVADQPGSRRRKRGKAVDKTGTENIQSVRPAIMKQVPDDLNA